MGRYAGQKGFRSSPGIFYALIRHPRYVEITLAAFGYAAVANYLGCWIVAIVTIPVLHLVVLMEERELLDRFGDEYRDYAARVPRYFPLSKV